MKPAVEWVDDLLACRDGEGTDATRLEEIAASIQRDALASHIDSVRRALSRVNDAQVVRHPIEVAACMVGAGEILADTMREMRRGIIDLAPKEPE